MALKKEKESLFKFAGGSEKNEAVISERGSREGRKFTLNHTFNGPGPAVENVGGQ